jgi:HAMP domain-containing protein
VNEGGRQEVRVEQGVLMNAPHVVLANAQSEIGTLYVVPRHQGDEASSNESVFVGAVNRSLLWAGLLAGAAALLVTFALLRRILGPIEALTNVVQKMERGDLTKRVSVQSNDEIGDLARAFNAPLMLAGSNGVHFFVYQNEPAQRLVILVATTDPRVRAPEVSRRIVALVNGRELPLNAPNAAAATTANTNAPALPDNAVGRLVAAYIKAFNSGDEKMVQAFLETNLAKASLATRPMEERLKIYQRLRGELGNLIVSSVAATNENGLAVTFQTATGNTAEFAFEMDSAEPGKLKGLRIELR